MVCGETWVMLRVAAVDCCVAACCVLEAQPRQKRKKEKLAPVAIVLNSLPKLHPKKNQTCQPKNVAATTKKCELRVTRLNVTGKKWLLQLPEGGLRIPLPCERCRILSTADTAVPARQKSASETVIRDVLFRRTWPRVAYLNLSSHSSTVGFLPNSRHTTSVGGGFPGTSNGLAPG